MLYLLPVSYLLAELYLFPCSDLLDATLLRVSLPFPVPKPSICVPSVTDILPGIPEVLQSLARFQWGLQHFPHLCLSNHFMICFLPISAPPNRASGVMITGSVKMLLSFSLSAIHFFKERDKGQDTHYPSRVFPPCKSQSKYRPSLL